MISWKITPPQLSAFSSLLLRLLFASSFSFSPSPLHFSSVLLLRVHVGFFFRIHFLPLNIHEFLFFSPVFPCFVRSFSPCSFSPPLLFFSFILFLLDDFLSYHFLKKIWYNRKMIENFIKNSDQNEKKKKISLAKKSSLLSLLLSSQPFLLLLLCDN